MNENTTKMLEILASKLGTTTTYLWSVLLKQAPISAVSGIVKTFIFYFACYLFYRLHLKLLKMNKGAFYDYNEGAAILMAIFGGVLIISSVMSTVVFTQNAINGFFNPEFWALNYITSKFEK